MGAPIVSIRTIKVCDVQSAAARRGSVHATNADFFWLFVSFCERGGAMYALVSYSANSSKSPSPSESGRFMEPQR